MSFGIAYAAVTAIRMAVLSHAEDSSSLLSGEIELDEANFGGRHKGKRDIGTTGKLTVFAILERKGLVHVSLVEHVWRSACSRALLRKSSEAM